jgi:putative oxidoreductase
MKFVYGSFLLRFAMAVIMLMHSIPSFSSGSVNDFGDGYLRGEGFGGMGLPLAWAIKLSHIAAAICLLVNRYIIPAGIISIIILLVGIWMVHLPNGWYVVGGGTNGVEFNFLLIFAWLSLMLGKKEKTGSFWRRSGW